MPKKQKILIITNSIPYPLYFGGHVRIFNIIKQISKQCEITLVCMSDRKLVENAKFLQPYCQNVIIVPIVTDRNFIQKMSLLFNPKSWHLILKRFIMLLKGMPYQVIRGYNLAFRDKLRKLLETKQYDIVQFEYADVAIYLSDLTELISNAKFVLDEHIISSLQMKRMVQYAKWPNKLYYIIQYYLYLKYEKSILSKLDHIITTTELEKHKIIELGAKENRVTAIKTGVEIKKFQYYEIEKTMPNLVFLGNMRHPPNKDGLLWFLDNVFPLIINEYKEATLVVIGEEIPKLTKRYENDHIVFRGFVERLEMEMKAGMLFIAPIRIGAGIRTKIITAMALGMPVVTTSVGIEGIDAGEAEGVIVTDNERNFANEVIKLLKNKEKRFQLGKKAKRFVEAKYSWNVISEELLMLYNTIDL